MTLAELSPGNSATIQQVDVEETFCKRCFALGLKEGAEVTVIRRSLFNGPIHIRVGTTDLVLRKDLANYIKVL